MDAQDAREGPLLLADPLLPAESLLLPEPPEPGFLLGKPYLLAENVARRICHDFASLLGTLNGLTELSAEDPEAALLATETARRLVARLQLVRGAWGGGGDDLDAAAITALADGLPGAERLRVDCTALVGVLEGVAARLCLCLLLTGAGAMPRGGTITVGSEDSAEGGHPGIWVQLDGPRAAWPASLTEPADASEADPRGLPAALCQLLAAGSLWRISVEDARAVARPA